MLTILKNCTNERPVDRLSFETRFGNTFKATSFVIPEFSEDIHHEIEIIVKINKVGKYIEPKFAAKYYDEISVE
jgi:2-keto-4-pentenoate hydratase/2-oxohepta-3-ene-1,7-dioic acid hydratase in catechol pathway